MDLKEYISTVNQKYRAGNATEHSYRGALEQLMQTLLPKLRIVNEPKRVKCGAPDYIASRKDGMPVFYIEAKDIGDNDLDGRNPHGHKEQFTRYKQALDYIIFTDYLDFHLYEHGEFVDSVRIAEVKGDKIVAINENEEKFLNLIEHVGNNAIQRITSASRLAKLMAGKARLLENIIEQAMKQIEAGAEILDVNVGVPGIDEAALMPQVVKKLQAVTNLPWQIDSSNADAIEAALRVYNGKPIVNSVNGDDEVMDRVLPIVKKYGAAVIGLTLDSRGIPATCEERFEIAQRIVSRAEEYGVPRENVIIDCLTLTASAQQKEVDETLKTVRMVKERLGLATALGVSNVSFGLPLRPVVNRTFMTMALENGLDLPIINPNDEDMMASIYAFNVLKNRDEGAAAYIERYKDASAKKTIEKSGNAGSTPGDSGAQKETGSGEAAVAHAIENGLEGEAAKAIEALLKIKDPLDIVNQDLIPALDRVGKGFERGEVFLPSMLQSAQAAQVGFDVIKKAMDEAGVRGENAGDVIIATVKGDIHDIGKNIVKVIMENYGFNMIDLGRDVPPEDVVDNVRTKGIRLVGLSALMTTTLASMEETIKAIKAEDPTVKVMVGGAVLTED